jgi:hypothetical protein
MTRKTPECSGVSKNGRMKKRIIRDDESGLGHTDATSLEDAGG